MSVFWKPVTRDIYLHHESVYRKKLGAGLYILWARCDVCTWSGAYDHFVVGYRTRPQFEGVICEACMTDENFVNQMLGDGWVFK